MNVVQAKSEHVIGEKLAKDNEPYNIIQNTTELFLHVVQWYILNKDQARN